MRIFLAALEVDPVDAGRGYIRLPLHCTVLPWFKTDAPHQKVCTTLHEACRSFSRMKLCPTHPSLFGPEHTVPVHVLEKDVDLMRLHLALATAVRTVHGTLLSPLYCNEHFRPHISTTSGRNVPLGETHFAHTLYIAEKIPSLEPYTRFVRSTIPLC